MPETFTSPEAVKDLYRKRASNYNFTANLYYLFGFREYYYREKGVAALELKPGDTVVEIGCGTGLNFPLLQEKVGPSGKIIGVDLTDAMLEEARKRVKNEGWENVQLVQASASDFTFPKPVQGVFSSFALTLVPEFEKVIENGAKALEKGRNFVVLDIRIPENWLGLFAPVLIPLVRPFAVSAEVAERKPWTVMDKYLADTEIDEYYFGISYIARGRAG